MVFKEVLHPPGTMKAGQADLVMAGQSFLLTVNFLVAHPMLPLRAVLLPFCESQTSHFL